MLTVLGYNIPSIITLGLRILGAVLFVPIWMILYRYVFSLPDYDLSENYKAVSEIKLTLWRLFTFKYSGFSCLDQGQFLRSPIKSKSK